MRLTRITYFAVLLAMAVSVLQNFPTAASDRATIVCRPVRWIAAAASSIGASMNDAGRVGPVRQPWHQDAHRACLRVAERLFAAFDEP